MNRNAKILCVSEAISPNLMLRAVADAFFDQIERSAEKTLTLDFSGVRSASRSFAHQYAIRKKASRKRLLEANMNPDVERMIALASRVSQASPKVTLPRVSKPQLITA